MANALELLLGGKVNIERPTKEVKLSRLSSDETDFVLTIEAITMKDFKQAQEVNRRGKELDEIGMNLQILTYGVQEFDGRRTENKAHIKELIKIYNVTDVQALINKLLLPGEIAMLASEIVEVSGFNEDMVQAVKKA